jgi:hypothetical protein
MQVSPVDSPSKDSVSVVKIAGQTICELRALRATLERTKHKGIGPIYYPAIHSIVDSSLKNMHKLLSVHGSSIEVWILRLKLPILCSVDEPFFIGATELATWKQLQEWIDEHWDERMHQTPKPGDPTEMVNEFLEHSGSTMECVSRPLPFVTSLPEPKKVDL